MRPLKVGILLPHLEGWFEGGTARWRDLNDIARTAEDVGLDSLWIADHLLYRFPGMTFGTWECWSLVSALAATTDRVELGTIVTVLPWRNPGLLAKIVDTADEISEGRIILGVGAGSHESEFPAFGFGSWDHKVARFEEELAIVRTLLRDGRIDHEGRFHTLRECELRPRGPRPNGPPIMVGAIGSRMLRATVAHADQWNIPWRHRLEDVLAETARGEAACGEAGRDPATLERSVCVQIDAPRVGNFVPAPLLAESRPDAWRGEPAGIADRIRAYAGAGVSHLQVWLDPCTPAAVEAFGAVLAELDG
jgi:alkanesulfonate monooxygenase SsuD/methylene tetrahydromethanopterin reductase-like flavin-dependent oxidoreductase (luciferase family)